MLKKLFITVVSLFTIIFVSANIAPAREITPVPHWQKKDINVYIPESKDKKTVTAIKAAFSRWQSASAGHINFTYIDKGPADIDIIFSDSASGPAGPFTNTGVTTSGNTISKAEITIANNDSKYKSYSDSYISKVFLHEVGRALGMPTNPRKSSSIMHSPVTEDQKFMKIDAVKFFSVNEWSYSKRRLSND